MATGIRDISVLLGVVASILQQSDTLRAVIPGADTSCHPALMNGLNLMKYRQLWLPGGSPSGPSQLPGDRAQQVGRPDLKEPGLVPGGTKNPGWTSPKGLCIREKGACPDLRAAQVQDEF